MGVCIKNLEMPTRCDDCVMGHELTVGTCVAGYGCLAMLRMGEARIRPISCGTKPDWCPLTEVPSADVEEVVRCKDCRHRDPEDHKCDCGQLERAGCVFPVDDDYFCTYGER